MFGSRWYKVLNDLWNNKTRTVLIVLSIAVGLFAVGTIVSSRTILSTGMAKSYEAINPASGTVRTVELFDQAFVYSVRAMQDVQEVDARRVIDTRVKAADGKWMDLRIFGIDNYDAMRVNMVWPQSGAWPPPEREMLIERSAIDLLGVQVGDVVIVETGNEKQREMRIAGLVHDPFQVPAQFDGLPYGYISFDTLAWFGEPHGFNELHIVARNRHNKAFAQDVVNQVKNKAEKNGLTIPLIMTMEPGMLPLDDILQAVLLLLGTLGLLSLFLSVFLIVNTISALLAQQKRQIGVMKAIGARSSQIMGMYVVMVTIYGLLALGLAIPLSVVGARELCQFMAAMFNFDLTDLHMPVWTLVLQVAVGLAVPVLASLVPFIANLRVTPAEAMNASYQMALSHMGVDLLDRLLSGRNLWFTKKVVVRPLLLSLRNTFRSKGRLVLTLMTLTLGSAIFVSVFSVQASLDRTLDAMLQWWGFDTMITFSRPYRVEKVRQEALRVPGVVQADVWLQIPVRYVRQDGSESGAIFLFAPRAGSDLVPSPEIVQGRWLLPEDENAAVVSTMLLKEEPDIRLGDEIVLKMAGRERTCRVVGVSQGILMPMAYVNYAYIARITGNTGQAGATLIATRDHDPASVARTTAAVEAHFEAQGLRVSGVQTTAQERAEAESSFGVIVSLLFVMAVLLALVGGLGLMGTMSINVLERTREIGVLRAIGAPNRGVARVFIREGVAIGVISWFLGSLLAIPLGKLLSNAVGMPLMGTPLAFSFSTNGVWLWFVLVVMLSALASFLPARKASRLTVREVLAYD
ncbi:MAG: ABC transporter permease [Anaerolineae bacterium]|nr:ABC transporter permease [Anaerolineae bacterium]